MSSQLSFSFELIALMEWLLKHGEKNLKVLIKETMKNGFVQEIDAMEETDFTNISNNLNQTVSDFVIKIEDILFQEIDRVSPKVNIHNALAPAIFIPILLVLVLKINKAPEVKTKTIITNNTIVKSARLFIMALLQSTLQLPLQ